MLKLPSVLKADLRAAMKVPRRPRDIREGVGRRGNVRSKGADGLRRLLPLPASAVPAGYSRARRRLRRRRLKTNTRAEPVTGSERVLGYQGRGPELCKRWKIG